MVSRFEKISKNSDLLLLGARGTGKSTLIKSLFGSLNTLWIDLLTERDEERYGREPDALSRHLREAQYSHVVIDEIQKFPKLLDIVHHEIEAKNKNRPYFVLTGSSARKLRRSGANLLAGRATTYYLFPFTHYELADQFELESVLQYGTLPLTFSRPTVDLKESFLRDYVRNYVKEEVLVEQLLREIEPFKDFLEVCAQMNGQIINYSKISRDVGVSDQTVRSFFQILEDTLIGFMLPSFHRSIRKRQREAPKFYFFDLGVRRALARTLKVPLISGTTEYGLAFEHFIVLEIQRTCEYLKNDFRISYLRTKDDSEIDLIIERPGRPDYLLEIKSTSHVKIEDTKTVSRFLSDWDRPAEGCLWSLDKIQQKINSISCLHWRDGFKKLFF